MNILVIDKTAEGQTDVSNRIRSFSQSDRDMLDLHLKLVNHKEYIDNLEGAEVIILGSQLGLEASEIARTVTARLPNVQIIMYVTEGYYSGGAFRVAHSVGVRKVLVDTSSALDLLQELVGIFSDFRRSGKVRQGRVVVITNAKGGTGATTLASALGEVSSIHGRKTMLWDLDVESRDLSRALLATGPEAKTVNGFVNGSVDITRETLQRALIRRSENVSVLMPPNSMAEAMDLVCHTDGMSICQRILDVARVLHDVIIIDTAGRISPSTGMLMRMADEVVIVIDETVLALTALDIFLSYAKELVVGPERITFIVNAYRESLSTVAQIEQELEAAHKLGERSWRLPPVPADPKAAGWPGSHKGFFELAHKETRSVIEEITAGLGFVGFDEIEGMGSKARSWWEKLKMKEKTYLLDG